MKKIIILLLLLCILSLSVSSLEISKIKYSNNIITKDIFRELKVNDALNSKSVLSIKVDEDTPKSSFVVHFKEDCGRVKSYTFRIKSECVEQIPIYEKSVDKNITLKIIGHEDFKYDCFKSFSSLPIGIYDYEIDADIELGLCSDGFMGYRIDWQPIIVKNDVAYFKEDWAWWNATGGSKYTVLEGGVNYTVHVFTSDGTFIWFNDTQNISVLVVAGGGSGGSPYGAGGGAGGLIYYNSNFSVNNGNYSVVIGSGGLGATSMHKNGTNSSFGNISSRGGGGGGDNNHFANGMIGGSGGGGITGNTGGAGTTGQGFAGGNGGGGSPYYAGGGGGGAGTAGDAGLGAEGGDGGTGFNTSINGSLVCYAGGGGGSSRSTGTAGVGSCGGGSSIIGSTAQGYNATFYGSGGGGAGGTGSSGSGFQGVVIVKYETYNDKSISFVSQDPADILSTTLFNQNINITYSVNGFLNNVNFLNFTSLSSDLTCFDYRNGSCIKLNNSFSRKIDSTINATKSSFILNENDVLPEVELTDSILVWMANKTNITLNNQNQYILMTYKNLSALRYGFFEIYAYTSSNLSLSTVYICNGSYLLNSAPDSNNNCYLFNSFSGSSFDHTHIYDSKHKVLVMPFNESSNSIGGVSLTSVMYVLVRGVKSATVNIPVANTVYSGEGIIRYSGNGGASWSNQTYTPDSHIHQFGSKDRLNYYGCTNESGNITCDTVLKTDNFDLSLLSPSKPFIYSPLNSTYLIGDNLLINHTLSLDVNVNSTILYNLSLLDSSLVFNKSIIINNSLNYYLFNTSGVNSGYYYVKVEAYDNYNLSDFSISDRFILWSCVEDWVVSYDSCLINDTRFKIYNDSNSCGTSFILPSDNGTYESCNYCSENIIEIATVCVDNYQNISYVDGNFMACCLVTGIVSDCSILYNPFNSSSVSFCGELPSCDDIVLDFPYYMDVDEIETINLYGLTSGLTYEFILDNSSYNFSVNGSTHQINLISSDSGDFNYTLIRYNLSNVSDCVITGILRFRVPYYVNLRFWQGSNSTGTEWSDTTLKQYKNEFQYVFMQFEDGSYRSPSLDFSYFDDLFSWMPFYKKSFSSTLDKEVSFWDKYDDGEAKVKLYDPGNYSIGLISFRMTGFVWDHEFIYPQFASKQYKTKIINQVDPLEITNTSQNYTLDVYISMWEVNKYNVLNNIGWNLLVVGLAVLGFVLVSKTSGLEAGFYTAIGLIAVLKLLGLAIL